MQRWCNLRQSKCLNHLHPWGTEPLARVAQTHRWKWGYPPYRSLGPLQYSTVVLFWSYKSESRHADWPYSLATKRRCECISWCLDSTNYQETARGASCCLRSHWEARSESASAAPCMIVSRSIRGSQTDCLCVYSLIVERLADRIFGVKHGVAAFAIQFLECCYNAATCWYIVGT